MPRAPQWKVLFYQDIRGRIPADEWIRKLDQSEQARIFRTIELLATYGVQLTMPYARHLRGKLWELRIAAGRKDFRVLYAAIMGRKFILLHAFSKATGKTPAKELEIAERRLADYLLRTGEEE